MRNLNFKTSICVIVCMSGAFWFCIAYISGLDLSKATDFFGLLPKVVSIDMVVIAFFLKWGWKWRLFEKWLVPFPNLSGSWKGYIHSDSVDSKTGKKLQPIPTILTIKQSFFHMSCVMRTAEMVSHSYTEGFMIDAEKQIKSFAYTYTSKPKLSISERSTPHDGTVFFEIIEKPKIKLVGRYWTERKTTGEIQLEFYSKEMIEEIPADFGEHPASTND